MARQLRDLCIVQNDAIWPGNFSAFSSADHRCLRPAAAHQAPAELYAGHASPKGESQYGNNLKAGHYAQAGDAKIYCEVYGKGRPFVLLHGGMLGATYDMHQFIDSLARKYQVIAISTRGHGKSELGTAPLTYEQRAGDVLAVLKAVTRDSAIVLGFSDGGFGSFKLASMYPQRVRKLIVIGASELYPSMRDFTFIPQQVFAWDSTFMRQQQALMPQPQRLNELFTQIAPSTTT